MPPAAKKPRPFIIPVFLPQEGCPHRCVFCDQKGVTGMSGAPALTPAVLRAEVDKFLPFRGPERGLVEIAFYGGNFMGLARERAEELLEAAARYVEEGRADGIRISTRPDTISPENLDLCRKYPVATIEMGVQSMDNAVLSASNRGHTAECAARAALAVKERNIRLGIHLMVGLPGESPASPAETARAVAELKPDFVRIHPTLVIAGSPLEALWRSGAYEPLGLEEAVARTLAVCEVMEEARITVARMGLFTPQGEAVESILAGPVHPAFGHMVRSAAFHKKAGALLSRENPFGKTIEFCVNPKSVSAFRGLKNANVERLCREFGLSGVRVTSDESLTMSEVALKSSFTTSK